METSPEDREARLKAISEPATDVVAFEKERIKGAVRTDFILSAEVIVIALGTMAGRPVPQQIVSLSLVGLAMVVVVYGLVAGLVKIDDLGLTLQRTQGNSSAAVGRRRVGAALLRAAPVLLKGLSIAGTAAMFMVGGAILVHGIPPLDHAIAGMVSGLGSGVATAIVRKMLETVAGVVAGAIVVGALSLIPRKNAGTSGATAH